MTEQNNNGPEEIRDWFINNREDLKDYINKFYNRYKNSFNDIPKEFHDNIDEQFIIVMYEEVCNLCSHSLALPIEMCYETIDDMKGLIMELRT